MGSAMLEDKKRLFESIKNLKTVVHADLDSAATGVNFV